MHAWRKRLGNAAVGDGDAQPAGVAIERARSEIKIHREKSVGERRPVGDGTANLIAAADGIIEFINHRVSAVGVRAAIVELALISERCRALGSGVMHANEHGQYDKIIMKFGFH